MWLKKPPILLFQQKRRFETVNKTEKSKSSNKTVDKSKSNKIDTVKSIDKSRYAEITDTVNKVDKSRTIPGTNLSNISARIENPTEIDMFNDN